MKRMIHVLAAMGAALVFGCAGANETQFSNPETGEACTQAGEPEQPYINDKEYNAAGCTRSERMANVLAFKGMNDGWPNPSPESAPGDQGGGQFGSTEQAINIPFGLGYAVTVNGQGEITGGANSGHCTPDASWTTARPLIGNCVIPKKMSTLRWAVDPNYGTTVVAYMKNRMYNAWNVWSNPVTCGSNTYTPALTSSTNSQQTGATTADRFALATIPVFSAFDNGQSEFLGHAYLDSDFYETPLTPIRNGIRYWGWDYMPIGVNHQIIEGIKADACMEPTDPKRALKIGVAYEYILAHELGHAFGLPHLNTGIMRAGDFQSCSEIYNVTTPSLRAGAVTGLERSAVADMKDSSGFSVHNSPDPIGSDCNPLLTTLPQGVIRELIAQ